MIARRVAYLFLALLLSAGASAFSRHNLDARSRALLSLPSSPALPASRAGAGLSPRYIPLVVDASSPAALPELLALGAVVFHQREHLVLCAVPEDSLISVDSSSLIDGASVARALSPSLDRARAGSGLADPAVSLAGLDGAGVVAGICDIGFDPSHIAFRGRVGMLSKYDEYHAARSVWAPGTSLHQSSASLSPDEADECHATHVAGIMAGSFAGNPYSGAAPASTLAVSLSQCSDVGLLAGIEDIVAYAREIGLPAVVNLSMSSYIGPHDGSDLVNQYLDLLGREAIIVFAAGNTGHRNNTISHTFSPDAPVVGANLESYSSWAGFDVQGITDIWSADSRPLDFQFLVWDVLDRREVFVSDWISTASGGSVSFHEDGVCPVFSEIFPESVFSAFWDVNPYNSRFNLSFVYSLNPVEELPGGNHWARYVAGWRVRGPEGLSVNAFSDGIFSFFRDYGAPFMRDGDSSFSISDLSCNRSTLSVGSWNSRNTVPVLGGPERSFPFDEFVASSFSSYGTLADGRSLPHVCAPGNYVVSATSSPYLASHPSMSLSHVSMVDGVLYAWHPECGTSMASPMAAGIIALWLQADPTLSVSDIFRIVALSSSVPPQADPSDPRWGAGAIDAAAGLRLLSGASVPSVSAAPLVEVVGRSVRVSVAGVPVPFSLFDAIGRPCSTDVPLSPGIYIIGTHAFTRKIVVR